MRAAQLVSFGSPPQLELRTVPDPVPGPGEVVVDLKAAALNRRDAWIWMQPGYCRLPVTLGSDGVGTISALGAGVSGVEVGDEVVIDAALNWGEREDVPGGDFDILGAPTEGTFAEKVAVPAANVAPKPARLTWGEAAALNLAGLAAWRAAVTCAHAEAGRSVLVTGAGSGVSTFLVQIAAARGARVFVTSSTQAKIDRALALGAVAGFRYDDPDWPEQARAAAGGGLDAVIDSYGGPSWPAALRALRDGGVLVTFGETGCTEVTIAVAEIYWHWRAIIGTTMGSPREFRALLAHVEQASWRPAIDSTFPLEEIAAAAARLEAADRFGKVVLAV